MKVAVLGCGPAGLLAALAVEQAGHEVTVLSRKEKSVIPGSVYLHESIPGLMGPYPDNHVQYVRLGTAEGYAQKVYGDADRTTGWEHYSQVYASWNAVAAYNRLWDMFSDRVVSLNIHPEHVLQALHNHDLVISTLPAWSICVGGGNGHEFNGEDYWIKTLPVPPLDAGRDIVIYNGMVQDDWYRWSVLSGVCSIETTVPGYLETRGQAGPVIHGLKATSTTCDCWPDVVRAGRWAEWRHGVLLNDAYKTVRDHLKGV